MTTTSLPSSSTSALPSRAPGRTRRVFLAIAALLACALPLVFTVSITGMLLTGTDSDHRFHQLTGQGLLLTAFWLGALLPLVRAGWRGDRPGSAAGWRHVTVIVAGAACAVAAPQGGAPVLVGVIALTGALLWWALPERPRLRLPVQVDPVLLPLALALTAMLTPFALDQISLQHAATGLHASNPHYFDMAWIAAIIAVQSLLAATIPALRAVAVQAGLAAVVLGAAGLALTDPAAWSVAALVLGGLTVASGELTRRRTSR